VIILVGTDHSLITLMGVIMFCGDQCFSLGKLDHYFRCHVPAFGAVTQSLKVIFINARLSGARRGLIGLSIVS
jgi:hypothetical protein